jgi:hypothetical protein
MLDVELFNQAGFALVHHVISDETIERTISEIENAPHVKAVKRKNRQVYAIRDSLFTLMMWMNSTGHCW